jgi:hypothetical protein
MSATGWRREGAVWARIQCWRNEDGITNVRSVLKHLPSARRGAAGVPAIKYALKMPVLPTSATVSGVAKSSAVGRAGVLVLLSSAYVGRCWAGQAGAATDDWF